MTDKTTFDPAGLCKTRAGLPEGMDEWPEEGNPNDVVNCTPDDPCNALRRRYSVQEAADTATATFEMLDHPRHFGGPETSATKRVNLPFSANIAALVLHQGLDLSASHAAVMKHFAGALQAAYARGAEDAARVSPAGASSATDALTETAGAGHWTASITDNWPSTRGPNARARVLHIRGTFSSEGAALAAAEAAIASGWVADNALHSETAKAHADFNLPQQEINRIGRLSAACAVTSTPEWKDRHPNLTVFLNRLWRGAESMNLSAEDDFRELYDAALDGKLEAGHLANLAVDEVRNSTDDPVDGLTALFNALLADATTPAAQQRHGRPSDGEAEMVRQAIAALREFGELNETPLRAERLINTVCGYLERFIDGAPVPAPSSAAPVAVAPTEPAPVRCGTCGWLGDAAELGQEGECGGDERCPGRPAEITDPADMLKAWQDSEGQICGKALAEAGLIEPKPATPDEAERLELEPGDTVWAISDAGYAVLRARNAEGAPTAAEEA